MSLLLLLKLIVVPALIGAITLAGRRWGPAVAGWLAAFPVVSAPILFFISLEQGAAFAASAATATLSAVLAIVVFGIGYAWAALRWPWWLSAVAGFTGYACAATALSFWAPSLLAAGLSVVALLLVAPHLYPHPPLQAAAHSVRKGSDMLWRMTAAAALVLLVTHFSAQMGPRVSGLLAMFPVMASVLAMFSHRHSGAAFAIEMMRGMVLGYFAFASFCLVLALALPHWGTGWAFTSALALAVLVQGATRLTMQHLRALAARAT